MLFQFIAGLLDENWTLGIELPDENIAGLLELKVAGRKTLPDFGIKVSQTKNMIGFLELRVVSFLSESKALGSLTGTWNFLDVSGSLISMVILEFIFEQENLKVLKISLNTTDSLLSLDIDFDSFSTLWTWKFDGLFLSSLDVKFGENIPLTRRFVFQTTFQPFGYGILSLAN
ncbi:hypothetical protein GLOIN_2v1883550 [Rhizophagus irregularis DAOM 181602=DAOM 197198]|uniref:Uncharacterized protein n=1 Tax=Rhizophagus irregularis (strain DAOM 181602 / DAOM 197198 / MUCL 43194) TaxID=747089 RepID=A0A2P4P7W6_RHIID|nr:hypothetical protein GLOIN_2v1883550 [Rhizophagus irregularis DAOM 181602=DAOM 197198]POG61483.1 hypothetical protein GLOIN_2v1883550 [Rhizophagus irregularis DAOM 181602=DAOM 197198]|eukprot:XP_025168349.1 hypothetical protein GLOIN_2v1883550 [Rhizophagus irregularis DAOM 181602=DAOM 197198]